MTAEDLKLWVRRVLAEKKGPVYQGNDCRCNRDATRLNCEWRGTKLPQKHPNFAAGELLAFTLALRHSTRHGR